MASRDLFGKFYETPGKPYYGVEPSGHLKSNVESHALAPGRALDIGCGPGRNALYLASLGFEVSAFDLSPAAIEELRALCIEHRLSVEADVADMMSYRYGEGAFDLIVAASVIGQAPRADADTLVDRWKTALAPNGCIYVSTFTTDDPASRGETASETAPLVDTFYDADDFRGLFSGLVELDFGVQVFDDTSHGPKHQHSVVRIFARKPA